MENSTSFPHSPNPCIQINQEKNLGMENFQQLIFKLAQTHPNKPLPPPAKALLQCRLNQFISDYKTPDHPPYSWMIEVALGELNEKEGSSVESISQHIEERHNNLAPAHPELLKHHLEKLVERGEIVVTCDKRYGLPGRLKLTKKKQRKRRQRLTRNSKKREEDELKYDENKEEASSEDNSNQTKLETGLSGLNLSNAPNSGSTQLVVVASAETLNGQTSSPVAVNNGEAVDVDELQPECRRLLHCDSKQELLMVQPTKRGPGRPRKRAETLNGQTSSPVAVNNGEAVDELQPECRRLLHCDSKQEELQMVQPTKRRPGRPRKQAETLNGQTSSPVAVNNGEAVDELQPECRRLLHCDSKQELQMVQTTKRRPGRPRKQAETLKVETLNGQTSSPVAVNNGEAVDEFQPECRRLLHCDSKQELQMVQPTKRGPGRPRKRAETLNGQTSSPVAVNNGEAVNELQPECQRLLHCDSKQEELQMVQPTKRRGRPRKQAIVT